MAAPTTQPSPHASSSTPAPADPPQALDSEEEETSGAKDKRTLPPTGAQKARRRRKQKKVQEKAQALEEAPKDGKGKDKERAQTPPDTAHPTAAAARTRLNWAAYPEAQQCLIDVFRQYVASSTADRTAIKEAA
ncbi:hypothetical protein K466DRAFT_606764, partial [Polyporus arcularius HHB13444]